jgi:hypothetical protein
MDRLHDLAWTYRNAPAAEQAARALPAREALADFDARHPVIHNYLS